MIGDPKEVYFDEYCSKCEYKDVSESDVNGKCWDCLEQPTMVDSHKPLYFKEADTNEKPARTHQEQPGSN